jgi:valyl-tRNA synthetase
VKLSNEDFLKNAPEEVVLENRERLVTSRDNIERIKRL